MTKCDYCGEEIPDHVPIYYDVIDGRLIGICECCYEELFDRLADDDSL